MNSKMKVLLGITGGVVVGGAVGYLIATSRFGKQAMKVIEEGDVRLPVPSYAVEVPYSEEQFAILDELVCECGEPLVRDVDDSTTVDELTESLRECIATELYPDFDWPPVSGDHPTVSQLYAELGLVARKALITTEICKTPLGTIAPTRSTW